MAKVQVYNLKGEKIRDRELSSEVFGLKKNDQLLHQIYVAQFANRRSVIAHTKDRSERAGSGKKPWKQKGTGRARVGSVRTPVWRKGGIVFGPTKERNFKKDIPKKMNRSAIKVALSEKLVQKKLIAVDALRFEEQKTKLMSKALENLGVKGTVLIGFHKDEKGTKKTSRNLEYVRNIDIEDLNVFDILNHKFLVLSEKSIEAVEKKFEK